MDQQKDMQRFLEDMGMKGCKSVAAPMANKSMVHTDITPVTVAQHKRYRSAVGSMQYYATMTQWHLSHPIARLKPGSYTG